MNISAITIAAWRNSILGRVTESYHDFKKALEIAPDFAPASEQLKNFVVTRVRAPAGQGTVQ